MILPFRTSAIFRNRWVALLWAAGICFMASEIVDSVSSVTDTGAAQPSSQPEAEPDSNVATLQPPRPSAPPEDMVY